MVYSLNRLRAVPQDGHASTEEIERNEQKKKNKQKPRESWEGGLSPVFLSAISLSPVLPSLDSIDWRGTARSLLLKMRNDHI